MLLCANLLRLRRTTPCLLRARPPLLGPRLRFLATKQVSVAGPVSDPGGLPSLSGAAVLSAGAPRVSLLPVRSINFPSGMSLNGSRGGLVEINCG